MLRNRLTDKHASVQHQRAGAASPTSLWEKAKEENKNIKDKRHFRKNESIDKTMSKWASSTSKQSREPAGTESLSCTCPQPICLPGAALQGIPHSRGGAGAAHCSAPGNSMYVFAWPNKRKPAPHNLRAWRCSLNMWQTALLFVPRLPENI